ncbi:MAG: alpha/beta fold hydrolase [Thermomicrobiales bacterium]
MSMPNGTTHDAKPTALATARLDRRSLLRRSALGFAIPAAVATAGLPAGRASAQAPEASPAMAEGGFASVNGIELYYEVSGTGDPLIVLHGGFGTTTMFGMVTPTLAQSRQVIAVDLQAHGRTADIDRPLSFEAMADDIAALIEHLGHEQVDLFGYSLGGGVSLQVAIRRSELVRKLVIASTPFRRNGWYQEILDAMATLSAETADLMTGTPFYEEFLRVAPRPDDWPTLVDKIGQLMLQDYDWTEDVRAITAPALFIYGDSDSVLPAHALELFALFGGGVPGDVAPLPTSAFAVLPQTAHSAVPFRADLLLPIITPFLDTPMPGAGA